MPLSVIRYCFASALVALGGLVSDQHLAAATNESPWLRVSWSSADGLPNNTIYGLVQTPDGFLWLGTPNGLSRFDGMRFEEFAVTNYIERPNRGINAMAPGRGGRMHLAMDRGPVLTLPADPRHVFRPDAKQSLLTVYSLLEDSQGAVWACYRDGSIGRIENDTMTRYVDEKGLPGGAGICSLANDGEGRLWFLKNGNFGVWHDGAFETRKRLAPGAGRLAPARDGGLWICLDFHLYKFTSGGELVDHGEFKPRLTGTEPSVIKESRDGAVWIGTTFSGLYRYSGQDFEPVPSTHQGIITLLEDAEGIMWAGTAGGGLNQLRPRAVSLETAEGGLMFEGVESMCEDTQGVIWAVMQNGALARLSQGRWDIIPMDSNWAGDGMSVCADPSGGIWVGTRFHRLARWREGRFESWGETNQIKGQTIHTLVVATNGDLWLGVDTPVAVQRLRKGKVDDFALPPDIRIIRASVLDAGGTVWFGTSKGVLMKVEGDRIVDETPHTTGEPLSIRGLGATPDGSLWIAYAGWGIGRLKNGKYSMIGVRQGLFDDFVSQILPDDRGWLWFGANRGLFKVRQEELDSVAEGLLPRVRSVYYGTAEYGLGDGSSSLQANFRNSPLALRSRDRRLWLPMRTGLVVVDPSYLRENTKPPRVLLTGVKIGETNVASYGGMFSRRKVTNGQWIELSEASEGLRVSPDHRRIEFEYAALSFVGPENNSFRYRLEGVDEDWRDTTQLSAAYPRLPAGPYRFRVIGCNSEGIWSERAAELGFIVTPFVWQTWWFRGAMLAAFTGMVIAIVRYVSFRRLRLQLRQAEAQAAIHRERARIAKDIHDDLGASLTQISLVGELARQDRAHADKVSDHIESMSGTARRAVKSLDEIVWAVNPRNDTLAHFIDYTGQYALDYLRVAGLRCRLDLPEHVPARELSTEVRHNLFLVVKEAITNCVKHARATELRLQVGISDEKLQITVEDNGQGFDHPQENATSDGLRNMRQRVEDIGGQCWVQGRPGAGVKMSLELPWSRTVNHD